MAPIIQLLFTLTLGLCAIIGFVYYQFQKPKTEKLKAPQADGGLPIIGHLHLLIGKELLHKKLARMADKHGPAFTLRLGSQETLVVSNSEYAKECFTTNDRVFSDRPRIAASRLLGYDFAMFGFAPYGPYWREMRKITVIELLSNRRVEMLKHIQDSEVKASLKDLFDSWQKSSESKLLVDMKQWFGELTFNAGMRMIGGKRFSEDCEEEELQRYRKAMREFVYLFGVVELSDAMPFLRWFDLQGYRKSMRRTAKELDALIEGWLEEHKQRKRQLVVAGKGKGEERDFMDVMLNVLEDADIPDFDNDVINKATCLNLILAGSDTMMVTLTWALSLLLNNTYTLKKAQEELNTHVSLERHIDESDIKNLVYLEAVIKETLRLYPPTPLIAMHYAMEDCTISPGDYHIRSGTRLMVNAYKIQRDESVWPEPNEFRPERFLTSHKGIDVRGNNFELIPFSSGRRSCPGISLAMQMLYLTLANLLHCYDIAKPNGEEIDMTESPGITNLKATPLELLLTPRLHPHMYDI